MSRLISWSALLAVLSGVAAPAMAIDYQFQVVYAMNPGERPSASGSLTAAPSSVQFDIAVGTPNVRSVDVTNAGKVPVVISGVGFAGGPNPVFAQSNNCGASLAVGASCKVNVQFSPTQPGTRNTTLTVSYANQVLSVPVAGVGRQGALQISSAALTFPTTALGSSASQQLTLSNSGNSPVELSAYSTEGADFPVNTDDCGNTLAAGQSCVLTVQFTPSATGSRTGSLVVVTPGGNRATSFAGAGTQGVSTLSTSSLTFAAVQQGATSAAQTVTLSNTGGAPLTVGAVAFSSGATQFSQTNDCTTVAPGASCTIAVEFAPLSASGPVVGMLTVTHNGTGPSTVSLSGTAQSPSSSLSPLVFAPTPVGSTATAQSTLTNTGVGSLSVTVPTAASVSGTGFTFVSTTCASTLAQNASCNVVVQFTAANAGNASGELRVATQAGEKLAVLAAQATQGAATLSVSTGSFALTQVEATATQSVTLTNTGSAPLVVSQVSVSAGVEDFSQTNTCASVPVDGQCTVTLKFTPTVAGSREGTLTLVHNGSGTVSLPLTGLAQVAEAALTTPVFSETRVGSASTATATLSNRGISAISLTTPTAASVTGSGYSFVSTTCGTSLATGGTCAVVVRFAPSSTVSNSGTLAIVTQAGLHSALMSSTGIQGLASVNPASLDFGPQQVSTGNARSVTVTNVGTAPLQLSGVGMVSGESNFSQSNNCGLVAVGASCTVTVAFVPTAQGLVSGTVGLAHDGGGVAAVTLTGEGRSASATLSTPSFGTTRVGASSTGDATLTNTGVGALSVSMPTSGSVSGSNFALTSTNCPTSLAVDQSCRITVRFAPTATTARTGLLTVNTGAGVQQASLAATGVQGFANANTGALAYATTQVGVTAASQSVILSNTGSSTLTFAAIGVSAGMGDFNQSNGCATLAVNESCTVTVAFTPTAAGVRNGTLSLVHDGGGVDTINLSGSGQAASATLSTPNFSATPVGSASLGYATLTNTGVGNLSVSLPGVIWAGSSSDFTYSVPGTTCTASLPSGQSCVLAVRFAPTSNAARTGTFVVNTGAGQQVVSLGSTGIIGYASVSPGSLTFGTQQMATTSAGKTITVTNTGTNTLTLSSVGISTGMSDFAQSNNCASVPVNGTCTVVVAFTPTASGSRLGTLSLTHNGGGVASVDLSGTGQVASATLSAPAFPATAINGTNTATATLTNTGAGAISVTVPTALSVTGASTDFAFVSTTCTTTLSASGTCTVTVRFTPASMGARTGTLSFATGAGTQSVALSASATAVDYSANLTGYVNPQVAIAGNPAWNATMGTWYSANGGGATALPAGDVNLGRSLTVLGSVPVTAKLRVLADNSINTVKVNGVLVLANSVANYQAMAEDASFTLYPGVNSITLTMNNAGTDLNPGGWILQVWNAPGTTMLADATGWAYSGPLVPVYFGSFDNIAIEYHDRTVASSCKQYRFPAAGYAPATGSGYYYVNMGAGKEPVYCDMVTDGGGWTLAARIIGNSTAHTNTAAVGTLTGPAQSTVAKLSDAKINALATSHLALRNDNNQSYYFQVAGVPFSAVGSAAVRPMSPTLTGSYSPSGGGGVHGGLDAFPYALWIYGDASINSVCRIGMLGGVDTWCGNGTNGTMWVR